MTDRFYRYRELRRAGLARRRIQRVIDAGGAVRLTRGVYVDGSGGEAQRLRALLVRLPEGTVLGFQTAATMHGFGSVLGPWSPAAELVHVIVPPGVARPRVHGVVSHEAAVPVRSAVLIAGLPCAPAARCAVDLARTVPRADGLVVLDRALRVEACVPAELLAELADHAGLRGVCRARELVGIADGRAECPQESHLRLIVVDGGLPVPEPQLWVADRTGRPAYRLDLGYPEPKVGLEYDGRSHLTPARLSADRSRMN